MQKNQISHSQFIIIFQIMEWFCNLVNDWKWLFLILTLISTFLFLRWTWWASCHELPVHPYWIILSVAGLRERKWICFMWDFYLFSTESLGADKKYVQQLAIQCFITIRNYVTHFQLFLYIYIKIYIQISRLLFNRLRCIDMYRYLYLYIPVC